MHFPSDFLQNLLQMPSLGIKVEWSIVWGALAHLSLAAETNQGLCQLADNFQPNLKSV